MLASMLPTLLLREAHRGLPFPASDTPDTHARVRLPRPRVAGRPLSLGPLVRGAAAAQRMSIPNIKAMDQATLRKMYVGQSGYFARRPL